jgi:hypothetical protein
MFVGKKTGQVAVLKKGDRFIYYLITKPKASGTPSYKSIEASLKKLKEHCVDNKVRHLSHCLLYMVNRNLNIGFLKYFVD